MSKYYRGLKPLLLLLAYLSLLSGCASIGLNDLTSDAAPQEEMQQVEDGATAIPDAAQQQFVEALAALQNDNAPGAEQLFQKMTVDYPSLSGPFLNLGIIYFNSQDYERSIKMLEQARVINSQNPQVHNLLGVIARQQGRFDDAETAYLAAIAVDEHYADAHLNLGIVYDLYMGRFDEAVTQYETYLSLTEEDNEKVTRWVADVKRRIKQMSN